LYIGNYINVLKFIMSQNLIHFDKTQNYTIYEKSLTLYQVNYAGTCFEYTVEILTESVVIFDRVTLKCNEIVYYVDSLGESI